MDAMAALSNEVHQAIDLQTARSRQLRMLSASKYVKETDGPGGSVYRMRYLFDRELQAIGPTMVGDDLKAMIQAASDVVPSSLATQLHLCSIRADVSDLEVTSIHESLQSVYAAAAPSCRRRIKISSDQTIQLGTWITDTFTEIPWSEHNLTPAKLVTDYQSVSDNAFRISLNCHFCPNKNDSHGSSKIYVKLFQSTPHRWHACLRCSSCKAYNQKPCKRWASQKAEVPAEIMALVAENKDLERLAANDHVGELDVGQLVGEEDPVKSNLYKGSLVNLAMSQGYEVPTFVVQACEGGFSAVACWDFERKATGSGRSKHEAEEMAAAALLELLGEMEASYTEVQRETLPVFLLSAPCTTASLCLHAVCVTPSGHTEQSCHWCVATPHAMFPQEILKCCDVYDRWFGKHSVVIQKCGVSDVNIATARYVQKHLFGSLFVSIGDFQCCSSEAYFVLPMPQDGSAYGVDWQLSSFLASGDLVMPCSAPSSNDVVIASHTSQDYYLVDQASLSVKSPFPDSKYDTYSSYFVSKGINLPQDERMLAVRKLSHEVRDLRTDSSHKRSSIEFVPKSLLNKRWRLSARAVNTATFLPSVLHELEKVVRVHALQTAVAGEVSKECFFLTPALTAPAVDACENYERLEHLGDSVLKMLVCSNLFWNNPEWRESDLTESKSALVSNERLAEIFSEKCIANYVDAQPNSVVLWRPAGFNSPSAWLSQKQMADFVEAILGAFFCIGGMNAAAECANWLGVIPGIMSPDEEYQIEGPTPSNWEEVLLQAGMSHFADEPDMERERLEFVGDAVIEVAVTWRLFECLPNAGPQALHTLRKSVVNNTSLAELAMQHHFGTLVEALPGSKCLADAFEAVAGAIWLHHGYSASAEIYTQLIFDLLRPADWLALCESGGEPLENEIAIAVSHNALTSVDKRGAQLNKTNAEYRTLRQRYDDVVNQREILLQFLRELRGLILSGRRVPRNVFESNFEVAQQLQTSEVLENDDNHDSDDSEDSHHTESLCTTESSSGSEEEFVPYTTQRMHVRDPPSHQHAFTLPKPRASPSRLQKTEASASKLQKTEAKGAVATQADHCAESVDEVAKSDKKNAHRACAGFMFLCSDATEEECLEHSRFGAPKGLLCAMRKIAPETQCFLWNFESHRLYGPFAPNGCAALCTDGFDGKFPAQITVHDAPIRHYVTLAKKKFIMGPLTLTQVNECLCRIGLKAQSSTNEDNAQSNDVTIQKCCLQPGHANDRKGDISCPDANVRLTSKRSRQNQHFRKGRGCVGNKLKADVCH